jgi:hypothetical protein
MKDKINELIGSIDVDEPNFIHIANTGNINGSLLVDLRRVLKESH